MTRETKIGLLVGLAFIIVIGILLSDHLTSSTEPPTATLAQAGSNVRQQVATPGGTGTPVAPIIAPSQVVPTQTIATQRDLNPPTAPTAVVQVGGPAAPKPVSPVQTSTPTEPPVTMPPAINEPTETAANNAPADEPKTVLNDVAQQHGEQLVSITGEKPTNTQAGKAPANAGKDYVVQPGDTLSKLATKFLGSASKANRDAIVKINPSLAADPNKLIVGKSYKIPGRSMAAAPVEAPSIALAPTPAAAEPVVLASAGTTSDFFYTVKPGDSLWKISSEQLGKGGSGVAALKELNKDLLNGGENVTPAMKLRLPAKPVN